MRSPSISRPAEMTRLIGLTRRNEEQDFG